MNKQTDSSKLLTLVNNRLATICDGRQPSSLYDPIRYVLSIGGKRLRPMLMLLAYNIYKDNPNDIIDVACGIETYHNYTLLHDDLMDNADLRRSHPTVHRKWDANTAILSGDSMLVLAYQLVCQAPQQKLGKMVTLFTKTALEIGEGQQFDMDFEHRNDVSVDEYIEMIRLKTSVLLACSLQMGACLADAPEADADLLYAFGEKLGLAFQLQDDYLDVYGDSEVFGKAIGGDIVSNKKTFMLINALLRADSQQRQQLMAWIEATDFDAAEKIEQVTRLYNDIGIRQLAIETINSYYDEAMTLLDKLPIDSQRTAALRAYARELMKREK